jgi:hypothetical protein
MFNDDDLKEAFETQINDHNIITIEGITIPACEVLKKFPNLYDKIYDKWFERQELTWVNTIDNDGYYKFNSMLEEDY